MKALKVIAAVLVVVAAAAWAQLVPISSTSSCVRAVGNGDAGAPWFAKTALVLSTLSTCGARCTGFFSATPFQPGYYCFVPSGGNANVGKIWMRLNRMSQPRLLPR